MNTENEIIVAEKTELPVFQIASSALEMRDRALEGSALIGKVQNAEQNKLAVDAAVALKTISQMFERARKAMKEPILEKGRQLDRAVFEALLDVEKELGRLQNLTRDFHLAEMRRVREEEEFQRKELDRIEQQRLAALANATTPEQVQAVEERASEAIQAESKPIVPTRTAGQIITHDWDIDVTNPYELAKFHPDCVRIEPLLTPIKQALNAGITVKGVSATKIVKANVRAASRSPIEI